MDAFSAFHASHPFWVWLAAAAIFLAVEIGTGSGWLLWPAACAGLVALLTLVVPTNLPTEIILFALATMAAIYLARRFLRPVTAGEGDLNDPAARLLGRRGEASVAFEKGQGRVIVDGKDWAAQSVEAGPVDGGQPVEVLAIDGATLTVRGLP